METNRGRRVYAGVADLYVDLFGRAEKVDPDDLAFIGPRGRPGKLFDLGCGPGQIAGYPHSLGGDWCPNSSTTPAPPTGRSPSAWV
ncbi:hypothetical protein [Actinoplanes sp. NPDC051411]|uniref:hypothetical protein n=1 Tax=Actinoplanes sp. NPDC051411 TaxID=3155522 RepID=UPI003428CF2C